MPDIVARVDHKSLFGHVVKCKSVSDFCGRDGHGRSQRRSPLRNSSIRFHLAQDFRGDSRQGKYYLGK